MKIINTELFPLPHYYNNKKIHGSLISWPTRCDNCKTNFCKIIKNDQLQICSYGYNCIKVNDSIIIGGILVRKFEATNSARKKIAKKEQNNFITKRMLSSAIESILNADTVALEDIEKRKERVPSASMRINIL